MVAPERCWNDFATWSRNSALSQLPMFPICVKRTFPRAADQLRVTFDRQIQGATFDGRMGLAPPVAGVAAKVNGVVLEIKFVDRFPQWMRDLVSAFNLQRCSMPKYVHCVDALGIRPGSSRRAESIPPERTEVRSTTKS